MVSSEAIEQWLSLQPTNIRKGIRFDSAETVGPLYHMSLDGNIPAFIPFVTRRASSKENISIPRVSVAPTIAGCFIGYMGSWADISHPDVKNKKHKNGWYLYQIPYEYCITPDTKLLFDQKNSDERWLVTYSPETRKYPAEIVAKMFYASMTIVPKTGDYPEYRARLLIEVLAGHSVKLGGDRTLEAGSWSVEGIVLEDHNKWHDLSKYDIRPISYGEYAKHKGLSADMLSRNPPPAAFKW